MKINLAIYTATEGFDWQPGSVYSRVELNKYKEMIGRFPDILMEDVPYGGIFVCEGRLVFYRFHKAQRWDSRGRDALYCVLGTIPLDAGRKVNLSRVFETREFSAPMRPFPVSIEITESLPIRPPSTWEELEEGLNAASSAAQVGVYATFFGHGKFFCRLDGSGARPALKLAYENCDLKPAPKVVPRPEPVAASRPSSASFATSAVQAQRERSHAEIEKRLLAQELDKRRIESENQSLKNIIVILGCVIVLALVVGIGAFVLLCGDSAAQNPQRPSGLISGGDLDLTETAAAKVLSGGEADEKHAVVQSASGAPGAQPITAVEVKLTACTSVTNSVQGMDSGETMRGTGRCDQPVVGEKENLERQLNEGETHDETVSKPSTADSKKANVEPCGKGELKSSVRSNVMGGEVSREEVVLKEQNITCSDCMGAGMKDEYVQCLTCDGFGVVVSPCRRCGHRGEVARDEYNRKVGFCWQCSRRCDSKPCAECKGSGKVKKTSRCKTCNGTGRIQKDVGKRAR